MKKTHRNTTSDLPEMRGDTDERRPGSRRNPTAGASLFRIEPSPKAGNTDADGRNTPTIPAPKNAIWVSMQRPEDPDLTNPSMSTELLAFKERRAANLSNKKKISIALGVVIMMTTLIGLSIWKMRIAVDTRSETLKVAADHHVETPNKEASVIKTEPTVDEQDIVLIQFDDLPKEAKILLNQQPVNAPIRTTRSNIPHFLEIFAGRERLFSATIIPDRDRLIQIPRGTPKKTKHEPRRKVTPQSSRKQPSENGQGDLSSNPFPLKKNPFSVGE